MRYLVIAAVLAIAACASAETPEASQSVLTPPVQSAQSNQSAPNYEDARSNASDAEIRDARRAYRSACQQGRSDGYCECMTGGMAQALAPSDLAVATAEFSGTPIQTSAAARERVATARGEVEPGCLQFR